MEFWPENQGQSPLYSRFGTVPGRNCTHNYHDRQQATYYPLYYGEQQDQDRESSYWTAPGSRTGGAPQEYTNWMDQDLRAPASPHFPFVLDRHPQQHHDLGEYQTHEAKDREWTAAQRAAREYERGFLRDGWQRRWEPCSPVRHNREASTKRSDSSYRELEAWAARYSHSLPRRRRIEAELRGASQGLLESSRAPERDSRSGTDPRVAALQQIIPPTNIRELGLWDRRGRQQASPYYPSQTSATDTSHVLDMKEKTGYQRRMFSQPPGYIAPPPYSSPHKSLPALHHRDTSWEQEGKRQDYWSQPTLRKQDVFVDHRKGEKGDVTKSDANQYTLTQLEGLKHQRHETDTLQASSTISIQKPHMLSEGMLYLQQTQVLQAVQNKEINEEQCSKVIEGRKFRLNKKTGGMTVFCLVSRIAGTTETPSLPLCASQTSFQNTEMEGVSKGDSGDSNQKHKFADEVDFRVPTLTEESNLSDARNLKAQKTETPSEIIEDNLSNRAETDVPVEERSTNDADFTFGRQVAQSVHSGSVKYPLWREPSFTSRAETEVSSTFLKANNEEAESDVLHNQEVSAEVDPIDTDVRKLDIKKEAESGSSNGLLVIDTSCVVVKMETIPSPKKELVQYVDSTSCTEHSPQNIESKISPESVQSNSQLNQDETTNKNAETNLVHINEKPLKTECDSDPIQKKIPEGESEISFPCMLSFSVSDRETLEERAERILGIPLHDCITEQPPEDATSIFDLCVEEEQTSPIKNHDLGDVAKQITEDTTEEKSQNQLEVSEAEVVVCLQEKDDTKDLVAHEGSEDFPGSQEQVSAMSEENDMVSQHKTDRKASPEIEMNECLILISSSEEGTTEQTQEDSHPLEDDTATQHSTQSVSPPPNLSYSSEAPNLAMSLSELNIEKDPDPELIAFISPDNLGPYPVPPCLSHTLSLQLPSPLPPGSDDFSPCSTPHTGHSPIPSPLALTDHTTKVPKGEGQDDNGETLELINNEIGNAFKDLTKDKTDMVVSQQQIESDLPDNADCEKETISDEQQTKEADKYCTDHIMEETLKISQESSTEVNILQKQLECVQAEDAICIKENYMSEEQLPKEVSEDPTEQIQTLQISKEDSLEVTNWQQQLESYTIKEKLPKEVNEDITGVLEQTISQEDLSENQRQTEVNIWKQHFDNGKEEDTFSLKEIGVHEELLHKENEEDVEGPLEQIMSPKNAAESQTQVNYLQKQFDNGQEEDVSCLKETCMTEKQSQKEADEDTTGLLDQPLFKENATDSQTQSEIENLQDIEPQTELSNSSTPSPPDSDCEVSQSSLDVPTPSKLPSPPNKSYKSDIEFVSLSLFGDAARIPETVSLHHLDSFEEFLQFPSSSSSDLPPVLLSSSPTPLSQEGSESVSSDLPLKEEPQYPKSLWDAVNRIRKHTAPDSETEEEEVSDLWDPESTGEDLGCPDLVEDKNFERIVFDEAVQQEVSTEGSVKEVGQIQEDPSQEEPSRHTEEDTLSCSSTSSHISDNTVITADEDEDEEMSPDAWTDRNIQNVQEFQTVDGEHCCSGEVKNETAAQKEEVDREESVTIESVQSEECPAEVANTNKVEEMMETEPKVNEVEESFLLSEGAVSDDGRIESESVK